MKRAREVFDATDAALTRAYHSDLKRAGHRGHLAAALLKAQKASLRAKKYRGGILRGVASYSSLAYARKGEALAELCDILEAVTSSLVRSWGWKIDDGAAFAGQPAKWVLYVELPSGQVSFHNRHRLRGPDFPGEWDGARASVERICAFCDLVMEELVPASQLF